MAKYESRALDETVNRSLIAYLSGDTSADVARIVAGVCNIELLGCYVEACAKDECPVDDLESLNDQTKDDVYMKISVELFAAVMVLKTGLSARASAEAKGEMKARLSVLLREAAKFDRSFVKRG